MKVMVEQEVDLPDEKVFKTILEDYYENEKYATDGWQIFSSFKDFIKIKYKQAIENQKLGKRY